MLPFKGQRNLKSDKERVSLARSTHLSKGLPYERRSYDESQIKGTLFGFALRNVLV
jgi:hypothetical protein